MSTKHVLGICGSLQARSTNLALLHQARERLVGRAKFVLFDGLRELPLFNPDIDVEPAPPAVTRWRRALSDADAVLIACPEYGHSLPGALKNGIDWVIGSGELNDTAVAITASVNIAGRGRRGLDALRTTLEAVDAVIVADQAIVRGPAYEAELARLLDLLANAQS